MLAGDGFCGRDRCPYHPQPSCTEQKPGEAGRLGARVPERLCSASQAAESMRAYAGGPREPGGRGQQLGSWLEAGWCQPRLSEVESGPFKEDRGPARCHSKSLQSP